MTRITAQRNPIPEADSGRQESTVALKQLQEALNHSNMPEKRGEQRLTIPISANTPRVTDFFARATS
jgi:hypothetical protein